MAKHTASGAYKGDKQIETKMRWTKYAEKHLLGRTITQVCYMTDKEVEQLGWYNAAVVFVLDDGSLIFPSQDDEGNNAGALFGQSPTGDDITMPVI